MYGAIDVSPFSPVEAIVTKCRRTLHMLLWVLVQPVASWPPGLQKIGTTMSSSLKLARIVGQQIVISPMEFETLDGCL
jgi:hypothetical protein